jgi:hypothetical protein
MNTFENFILKFTLLIIKHNNLQFKRYGIGSIFNLQEPGEHAICGPGIKAITGLSYTPETFMDKNGKLVLTYT